MINLGKAEANINHLLSDMGHWHMGWQGIYHLTHTRITSGWATIQRLWWSYGCLDIYPYMSILALRCMGTSDVITFPAKLLFKEIYISHFFEGTSNTEKTCYRLSFNHMYVIASFVIQRHYIFSGGTKLQQKTLLNFLKKKNSDRKAEF